MTLWQARLGGVTDESVLRFTESLSFDIRLAPYDIEGSRAHVHGLARSGIITAEEESVLLASLNRVGVEFEQGTFEIRPGDEDIHTAVERRVTELAGDTGSKLHTGRSRNDQVATDLRMYVRSKVLDVMDLTVDLEDTLLARAVDAGDTYMPGYTHLQRAQPVMLAHHFLAHAWAFSRDVDRLSDLLARMDVSPLGAGALAGSSLPLDPVRTASDLGFDAPFENSLDAVSDRDFVAEALFDLALIGVHLSRIGEEIVIWSSEEFGFVTLDDKYATGSSMLPHKKNPDVAELARGKAGRLLGNLAGFLATLKGLPLAYNRDLQEDKEPTFDSFEQVERALPAVRGMIDTMTIRAERMIKAVDDSNVAAIDLAEWLVERKVPFRVAHGMVASLVKDSIERGVPLSELVVAHPDLGYEAAGLLEPGISVKRRTTWGGAGPVAFLRQLERFKDQVELDRARISSRRKPKPDTAC
ncbi:MAG: argininosuccinate lyase [Acidimicrobiales bacterium]